MGVARSIAAGCEMLVIGSLGAPRGGEGFAREKSSIDVGREGKNCALELRIGGREGAVEGGSNWRVTEARGKEQGNWEVKEGPGSGRGGFWIYIGIAQPALFSPCH